jgi:hypothetical protein
MRSKSYVLVLAGLIFSSVAIAQTSEPLSQSPSNQVTISGTGVLSSKKANKGRGTVIMFTPITPASKPCGGSCGGQDVGSWTCPDNLSCALDCTTRPPRKYCLKL